jgi:hypothetical protein
MAKIGCKCGHVIRDQSDYLPYKADYISDSVSIDLVDQVSKSVLGKISEVGVENTTAGEIGDILWSEIFVEFGRQIFECEKCGRLLVQKSSGENLYLRYKPELEENDDPSIRSIYNDLRLNGERNA